MSIISCKRFVLSFASYAIIVAVLWVLLYQLNKIAFSQLTFSVYITLIFIPAGLRLVAILLFDEAAVLGLFVGAIITSAINASLDLPATILISFISAVSPYFSVALTKYVLNINDILHNLYARQLILLSLISAVLSSVTHNIFFYFYLGLSSDVLNGFLSMFVGDFLGCLLLLYLLSFILKWMQYSHKKSKLII